MPLFYNPRLGEFLPLNRTTCCGDPPQHCINLHAGSSTRAQAKVQQCTDQHATATALAHSYMNPNEFIAVFQDMHDWWNWFGINRSMFTSVIGQSYVSTPTQCVQAVVDYYDEKYVPCFVDINCPCNIAAMRKQLHDEYPVMIESVFRFQHNCTAGKDVILDGLNRDLNYGSVAVSRQASGSASDFRVCDGTSTSVSSPLSIYSVHFTEKDTDILPFYSLF
jgi:hypothetical protein